MIDFNKVASFVTRARREYIERIDAVEKAFEALTPDERYRFAAMILQKIAEEDPAFDAAKEPASGTPAIDDALRKEQEQADDRKLFEVFVKEKLPVDQAVCAAGLNSAQGTAAFQRIRAYLKSDPISGAFTAETHGPFPYHLWLIVQSRPATIPPSAPPSPPEKSPKKRARKR